MTVINWFDRRSPMMHGREPLTLDQPAVYRIEVQGRINGEYGRWLEQGTIEVSEGDSGVTTVLARVADQAELHGLLQSLYALGLPLLSVMRLAE